MLHTLTQLENHAALHESQFCSAIFKIILEVIPSVAFSGVGVRSVAEGLLRRFGSRLQSIRDGGAHGVTFSLLLSDFALKGSKISLQ